MTSRTRTMGGLTSTPIDTWTKTTNCSNVVTTSSNVGSALSVGTTKTTVDVVTPNFRKKVAAGAIINNPFSSDELSETGTCGGTDVATKVGTCSTVKKYEYNHWATRGDSSFNTGEHVAALASARIIAGTQAMANVAEPTIQGLVELAELRKTARMIPDHVRTSIAAIERLKRSKHRVRGRGKVVLDYIARSYLGYRYGITPTLMTVNELLGGVVNRDKGMRFTARGFSSTGSFSDAVTDSVAPGFFTSTHSSWSKSVESIVRAGVLYEHYLDFDRFGLSPGAIPSAALELIPYSFVAEWIANVSDYIAAVVPKAGVRILATWTKVETVHTGVSAYYTTPNVVSGWTVTCGRAGSHSARRVVKTRTPGVAVGLATRLHEIRFEKDRDFIHAADALALWRNVLLSRL